MKKLHGRVIKMSEQPKRVRHAKPRTFKALEEDGSWNEALTLMAQDGIGVGEAYVLIISPELMAKYNIPDLKAAARPVKDAVRKIYKKKYQVDAYTIAEGPAIFIKQPLPR